MAKGTYTYEPGNITTAGLDLMRFELGDTMVEGGADTCALTARFANSFSAPINSVVSDKTAVPPDAMMLSATSPTSGFAASPLVGSEPPHSIATISSETSASSRCIQLACATISLAQRTACSTVCRVPPHS